MVVLILYCVYYVVTLYELHFLLNLTTLFCRVLFVDGSPCQNQSSVFRQLLFCSALAERRSLNRSLVSKAPTGHFEWCATFKIQRVLRGTVARQCFRWIPLVTRFRNLALLHDSCWIYVFYSSCDWRSSRFPPILMSEMISNSIFCHE
jgi:hypothetical protein